MADHARFFLHAIKKGKARDFLGLLGSLLPHCNHLFLQYRKTGELHWEKVPTPNLEAAMRAHYPASSSGKLKTLGWERFVGVEEGSRRVVEDFVY